MKQSDLVNERDFFYKREITHTDRLKFLGVALLSNYLAHYYMLCSRYLTRFLIVSQVYVIVQALCLIPIALLLPPFLIKQYIRAKTPHLFSLLDNSDDWHNKAFSWIAMGEFIRFLIGFIPLSVTKFGIITSPITYLLYESFYLEPLDKFDTVILNNHIGFFDAMVFLLIYGLYFLLHSYFLSRKIKKEVKRHLQYLQGCLNEKEKYYHY